MYHCQPKLGIKNKCMFSFIIATEGWVQIPGWESHWDPAPQLKTSDRGPSRDHSGFINLKQLLSLEPRFPLEMEKVLRVFFPSSWPPSAGLLVETGVRAPFLPGKEKLRSGCFPGGSGRRGRHGWGQLPCRASSKAGSDPPFICWHQPEPSGTGGTGQRTDPEGPWSRGRRHQADIKGQPVHKDWHS